MAQPLTHLGDMPIEEFIRDYWQQKPLLIRQAFKDFTSPISADELAGLALEEDIESRLILEEGSKPWELRCGPFDESEFSKLPKNKWTLLVQAVDHFEPSVADLLDHFRFIPNWRLDDVMISYAVDGGSVGPHFDQYDVFLLQAEGQRHWQLGQECTQTSPKIEGIDLHILSEFLPSNDWVLEPGDMLYIPPQLAHWGRAIGNECMTYSIGFRAPSQAELLNDFVEEQLSLLTEDNRLTDSNFAPQENPGEISDTAIDQVSQLLSQGLKDKQALKKWFGRLMTQPKYNDTAHNPIPTDDIEETLSELQNQSKNGPLRLERNPASRFAFNAINNMSEGQNIADLYVDGLTFAVSLNLAETICANRAFNTTESSEPELKILAELIELGCIGWQDEN